MRSLSRLFVRSATLDTAFESKCQLANDQLGNSRSSMTNKPPNIDDNWPAGRWAWKKSV